MEYFKNWRYHIKINLYLPTLFDFIQFILIPYRERIVLNFL